MANRPSLAYDCGVVRGGQPPANALMVRLHARGGNFVCPVGSGQPGEWLLTLDDFVPTSAQASFWYGYHVDYDLDQQVHDPPEAGVVADYTMCRVVYTIEWARRTFPVDTARVYAMGTSMGGIGSMMLALRHPNLLAGVFALVPKFDFSYLADPVATSQFNEGNPLRYEVDRLWCPVAKDLPSSEGVGTYEALNAGYLAALHDAVALPPIIAFNGKNDNVVGWAEKIPFYRTMNAHRHGGYFFFDQRAHVGGPAPAWGPMEDPRYLYRFRLDRSYPALSNCSASQNPGDGLPTSGDSVGAINASVEWDTSIVDQPATWQVTLRLRDLQTSWGVIPAPGLVMVDVTPRRLQLFLTRPYRRFLCTIRQLSDTTLVGLGTVMADSRGLVTVPNVIVRKPGTVLTLTPVAKTKSLEAEVVSPAPARLRISLSRNPVVGEGTARVEWSGEGEGEVDLIGVSGRLERQLLRGPTSGTTVLRLDGGGLPAGVYFLRARQGGETAVERVVVLR
jgi:pimeloyl-ACP methyl ester carboxylesterase